jgi:hypothetical protein
MYFDTYDTFYSKCSHHHVSADITTILRVMLLLKEYKITKEVNCVIAP